MNDVITIGDAMITFNPSAKGPMKYVPSFERKVGGAELNFAIGCSRLDLNVGWISRLGNDEFGKYILNFVRGEGIDVSEVHFVEEYPTSLNFKEIMEDGSGRTFYYRKDSPTITITEDSISEEYISKAKVLHLTGVFLALDKEKNLKVMMKAIEYAKKHGLLISFDPNLRLKLWTKKEAKDTIQNILPFVDVLLTGEEEAEVIFGVKGMEAIIDKGNEYNISHVIIKQGDKGATGFHGGVTVQAPPIKPKKVVDTVGAGDGFNAGFIYGVLKNWSLEKSLHFANTIGSMVVSVSGDNEGLPYIDDVLIQLGEKQFVER